MSKISYIQLGNLNYTRKNIHLIKFWCKCLLLSISGLVFLYLVINTVKYRQKHEFNELMYESYEERHERIRHLLEQNYRLKWNHETVYLYKKLLGLDVKEAQTNKRTSQEATSIRMSDNNQTIYDNMIYTLPKDMTLVCAFPGNTLHDHMWEYLSLLAIHHQYRQQIKPTISMKANKRLRRLLQTINMTVINEIKESDYDLAYAKIIGHTTPVLPLETVESKRIPLLLEQFAKRYSEILNGDMINWSTFVMFYGERMQDTYAEMNKIKVRYGWNRTDESVQWVGMYIDNFNIPLKYYQSAMLHFLQRHSRTIFIVICSPDTMPYYISGLGFHSPYFRHPFGNKFHTIQTAKRGTNAEIMEFMLLSHCNSTIISNTHGVMHALLNGGVATFYRPNNSHTVPEHNIPYTMGKKISNWLEIT